MAQTIGEVEELKVDRAGLHELSSSSRSDDWRLARGVVSGIFYSVTVYSTVLSMNVI